MSKKQSDTSATAVARNIQKPQTQYVDPDLLGGDTDTDDDNNSSTVTSNTGGNKSSASSLKKDIKIFKK